MAQAHEMANVLEAQRAHEELLGVALAGQARSTRSALADRSVQNAGEPKLP